MKLTAREVLITEPIKRQEVLAWVQAHGLDPSNVRSVSTLGQIGRAEVYVLDDNGQKQIHPDDSDRVWTRINWFRIRSPFPSPEVVGFEEQP